MPDEYYTIKAFNERISKRLKKPTISPIQKLREAGRRFRLPKFRP